VGPVQREVLRHEIAVADEVVLLNDDGSESAAIVLKMRFRPWRPWGPAAWLIMSSATRSSRAVGSPRLLTSKQIFDDVLRVSLRLVIHPVVIGHGTSLFAALREPLRLDVVEARTFPSGTTAHICRPLGGDR